MLASGTLPPSTTYSTSQYEGFDNHPTHTLPARAPYPIPSTHITLNPYSSQLVDNINRMMASNSHIYQSTAAPGHIYQVAMSPQLSQLTNTLRKKKCLGGHPGPCHHRNHDTTDSSVRSDSVATNGDLETETEMVPPAEVVFRAVSPHGHVYWEIDPKRPGRLVEQSDSDTNNDMHNMSDFSEEDGKVLSDRSRQSSSRFSDNRPLIPANMGLTPLPEYQASPPSLIQFSPAHRGFSSLHRPQDNINSNLGTFSTRTRLRQQAGRIKGSMEAIVDEEHTMVPEQVQQQVQIPDLRRIPVSVKSSEYIMAKIQSHMDQRKQGGAGQTLREREV